MVQMTQSNPSTDALDDARREGARAERLRTRRRLLFAGTGFAAILVAVFLAGWVLVVQARDAAPEVISQMAAERRAAVEQRLNQRVDEAGVLVGELFGFLEIVWRENESLSRIQSSVGRARAELSLLDGEVRAALNAPLTELKPLLKNGPTRARQLAENLVVVAAEIRRLVPTVFYALGDAQKTFAQSPDGASLPAIIASLDALFEPFIGPNEGLRARWASLKKNMLDWVSRVEADVALTRRQMHGDTLGDEFVDRMTHRLF